MSLEYGPDTEELLRRYANIKNKTLYIPRLRITHLPPLPEGLENLYCFEIPTLTSLPEKLPDSLLDLTIRKTNVSVIPPLPPRLEKLCCSDTPVSELPMLPNTIHGLWISGTKVSRLPNIPRELLWIHSEDAPLNNPPKKKESQKKYIRRLKREWRAKKRVQARTAAIKEEMMAAVMHPIRIGRLIENHGFDVLEWGI